MNPEASVGIADILRLGWYVIKLTFLAGLIAEAFGRIGSSLTAFFRYRPGSELERFGVGFLSGFALVGPALLSLALGRLYSPIVIWPLFIALVAGAGGFRKSSSLVVSAIRELKPIGALGGTMLGLSLVPMVYYLLTPEAHIDSYIYHLATPWHYLENRGAVFNLIPAASHLSLPVETVFTLPLLLGDDRLTVWLNVVCFLAVSAVFAGHALRRGGPMRVAAWIGPLLALAGGYLFILLRYAKNDTAAAALFIAGALLSRSGSRTFGAVLLGMSGAAKPVCGPLALIWLAFYPPPLRRLPLTVLFMAIWPLPWLGKEFLVTGNPVYPFASSFLPSLDWGPANVLLIKQLGKSFLHQDTYSLTGLIPAWIKHMGRDHLVLLALLPGLLLVSSAKRAAAALLIGQFVILGLAHHTRYLTPAVWLLALLAAEEACRLKGKWLLAGLILLTASSVFRIALTKDVFVRNWRELFMAREELQAARLTTYYETLQVAQQLEVKRTLYLGERRSYLMPGRLIYGGTRGETPLIWRMARESDSYERLRRKFRQLGASHLIYNYVSAEWLAQLYTPFKWTPRMVGIYKEFALKHMLPVTHNATNDFNNGGFYVFRLLPRPLDPPQGSVWFLPGTEPLFGLAITYENLGRKNESLQACLQVFGLLKEVGHAWNQVGHAYTQLNDSKNAYRYLKPFFDQAMMDQLNVPELGSVAVRLGRLDMAQVLLDEAKWRYPDQIYTVYVNEALLRGQRAYKALVRKNLAETERYLAESDRLLELVPEITPNPTLTDARRSTVGALMALKAELMIEKREFREAGELYREAVRIYPASPQADRWKALAKKYAPLTLSFGAGERSR